MTDRVRTIVVTLDRDYRTDDVEAITNAIRMTKGVAHVETGPVVDLNQHSARMAFATETGEKLLAFVRRELYGWKE